jgi:hypothetical protein
MVLYIIHDNPQVHEPGEDEEAELQRQLLHV